MARDRRNRGLRDPASCDSGVEGYCVGPRVAVLSAGEMRVWHCGFPTAEHVRNTGKRGSRTRTCRFPIGALSPLLTSQGPAPCVKPAITQGSLHPKVPTFPTLGSKMKGWDLLQSLRVNKGEPRRDPPFKSQHKMPLKRSKMISQRPKSILTH